MSKKTTNILDCYPEYEATVGIEVHTQLNTKTKIFCGCANQYGDAPNSNICPICAGYPGVLPVLNKRVVDSAIKAGLATHCHIRKVSDFSRKHYFYPDIPKNFQITQGDKPICEEGYIPIDLPDGTEKKIRLQRIHIEEDSGKNIHTTRGISLVNLNRAGAPLLELVTYPDMSSSHEACSYLTRLHAILRYLEISNADMEKGTFRADINISVKTKGAEQLGKRVELKNINSFKFVRQAIDYEIERQINLLESGSRVKQETRQWNSKKHETVFMRSKEGSLDYRYFTEPDLPLIIVDDQWRDRLKEEIPELPHQKFHRFQKEYGLSANESDVLVGEIDIANFFEQASAICKKPQHVCNWILRDLLTFLNEHKIELHETKISPESFAELVTAIDEGIINSKVAKDVFIEMAQTGKYPSIIVQEKGLKQIDSREDLEPIIVTIINENPDQASSYRGGKERLFMFFVGKAMKATKGKANPNIIKELLEKHLNQ